MSRQERIAAAYQTLRNRDPEGCKRRLEAHATVLDGIAGCGEVAALYLIGQALADVCKALAKTADAP